MTTDATPELPRQAGSGSDKRRDTAPVPSDVAQIQDGATKDATPGSGSDAQRDVCARCGKAEAYHTMAGVDRETDREYAYDDRDGHEYVRSDAQQGETRIPFFKTGNAGLDKERWFVTDFTKEQVELRIADLERQLADALAALETAERAHDAWKADALMLLAKLEDAKGREAALRRHVKHDRFCGYSGAGRSSRLFVDTLIDPGCTCGLTAALTAPVQGDNPAGAAGEEEG